MWRAIRQIVFVGFVLAGAGLGIMLSAHLASGSRLLSVQSGSMVPAIKKGDLVAVQRTPTRDLRVGDVITYTSPDDPGVTYTHRIVALTGDMAGRVVTKGDANEVADPAVYPAQIIGRVERVVPYAGFVVDAVRHPLGLLAIIYLPALLVIIAEIRSLTQYFSVQQRRQLYRVYSYHHNEGLLKRHG